MLKNNRIEKSCATCGITRSEMGIKKPLKICMIGWGIEESSRESRLKPEWVNKHPFTNIVYSYEGNDYSFLLELAELKKCGKNCCKAGYIFSVCRDYWCLDQLAIFRKLAMIFQSIQYNMLVEAECSDIEIERKIVFYYLEKRKLTSSCIEPNKDGSCPHLLSEESECRKKRQEKRLENDREIYELEKKINTYKNEFRYCFCRKWDEEAYYKHSQGVKFKTKPELEWWNGFKPLYDTIMNFEKQ